MIAPKIFFRLILGAICNNSVTHLAKRHTARESAGPESARDEATGSFLETLQSYASLGPITHMCVVEIDTETGEVDLQQYVAVDDCGVQVNPLPWLRAMGAAG